MDSFSRVRVLCSAEQAMSRKRTAAAAAANSMAEAAQRPRVGRHSADLYLAPQLPVAATAAEQQPAPVAAAAAVVYRAACFARLADVELQLIFHLLDRRSKLQLARCNRQSLRCASSPLVWQGGGEFLDVRVRGSQVESPDFRLMCSLLRLLPTRATVHADESCKLLAALSGLPKLSAIWFVTALPAAQLTQWHRFLGQPPAQRLLDVDAEELQPADPKSVALLSRLPLLRSLKLSVADGHSGDLLQPLAKAPSLTELSVASVTTAVVPPVFTTLLPLTLCTRLQALHLKRVLLQPGELCTLLERLAANGAMLRHLGIESLAFNIENIELQLAVELSCAARFLPQLQSLDLHGQVSALYAAVPHLPSLQLLVISAAGPSPPAHALEMLLQARPTLRMRIVTGDEEPSEELTALAERLPRLLVVPLWGAH